MRPKDLGLAKQLDTGLLTFGREMHRLPGIHATANREAFVEQLVESIRRIRYITVIRTLELSIHRADPATELFDPLKAAVLHQRQEEIEEAFWLVFLSVHFGKNRYTGWRLARDVYGRLGAAIHWDWARTSSSPKRFRQWLATHQDTLRGGDGVPRHFGNHRKYQSLDAWSTSGTGAAIESYVRWVRSRGTHQLLVQEAQNEAGDDPRGVFDYIYRSMFEVMSFGRTARFDYLTMLGKLGLAPIEPGSTYLEGATGPLTGARLLFEGSSAAMLTRDVLDARLVQLGTHLDVGMQVLEDALCNWQKSPSNFKRFRG
jgi:Alpha-glutamyl/putrescinyl thymine pyrophosphorylase clade 3